MIQGEGYSSHQIQASGVFNCRPLPKVLANPHDPTRAVPDDGAFHHRTRREDVVRLVISIVIDSAVVHRHGEPVVMSLVNRLNERRNQKLLDFRQVGRDAAPHRRIGNSNRAAVYRMSSLGMGNSSTNTQPLNWIYLDVGARSQGNSSPAKKNAGSQKRRSVAERRIIFLGMRRAACRCQAQTNQHRCNV